MIETKHPLELEWEWQVVEDELGISYCRAFEGFFVEVFNTSVIIAFTDNDDAIVYWVSATTETAKKEAISYVQQNYAKLIAEVGSREVYAELCGGRDY